MMMKGPILNREICFKMCNCYDPNGPKYCDFHKESMISASTSGLESKISYSESGSSDSLLSYSGSNYSGGNY